MAVPAVFRLRGAPENAGGPPSEMEDGPQAVCLWPEKFRLEASP